MKTISQVAKLTGISTRPLQYYDEIGLLKPTELTLAGYRRYDEQALQNLQQILFFRELDFPLKDIIKIMQNPDFDRISAFKKQKELLLLKRNRTYRHNFETLGKYRKIYRRNEISSGTLFRNHG